MKALQAIRGMHDITPTETGVWREVEQVIQTVLQQYGYQEIRVPLLEMTSLFHRGVGEHTDIVEKEMYSFPDRNEESLTLRPEFTASIVRAGIEHGLFYNQIQKVWSMGALFRYERPQKGRNRQFHQCSVECFGVSSPAADAELIMMCARIWKKLRLEKHLKLELNTLGNPVERKAYRADLISYLTPYVNELDEDSQRRLSSNPLRILDSKVPSTQAIIKKAPVMTDYLSAESRENFETLCHFLDQRGIEYVINDQLVRGLDYYCHTVFEWTTDQLGAQGTVCGGGRYDPLIEQLGGKPTSACGFALGFERLILLLETVHNYTQPIQNIFTVTLILASESVLKYAMHLVELIRDFCPEVCLLSAWGGSLKSQMKRANMRGSTLALMVGDEEAEKDNITIKYLNDDKQQEMISKDKICQLLNDQQRKNIG